MIRRTESAAVYTLLIAAVLLATGCHSPWSKGWGFSDTFDLNKRIPWSDDGPREGTPIRVVDTWTDTVLHQTGKPAQRGFGGRLIFYDKQGDEPILVEGRLVVYAFDETGREITDNKPTRRYVFPADQLARHQSESELGASYSFWLPWDEVGGPQTEISLICRFEPNGGPTVVGEQTKHVLPGTLTLEAATAAGRPPKLPAGIPTRPATPQTSATGADANGVQLASYDNQAGNVPGLAQSSRRMTTTSISLPGTFRLRGGAATVPAASAGYDTGGPGGDLRAVGGIQVNGSRSALPATAANYAGQLSGVVPAPFQMPAGVASQPMSAGSTGNPAANSWGQPIGVSGKSSPAPQTMPTVPPGYLPRQPRSSSGSFVIPPPAPPSSGATMTVPRQPYYPGPASAMTPPQSSGAQVPPQAAGGLPTTVSYSPLPGAGSWPTAPPR